MTAEAADDIRIGQLFETPDVVPSEAQIEHCGQNDVDQITARRAVVVRLLLPIAFANKCRLMDFRACQAGDRLRQMATIAHAHVAPLVRYVAGKALGCAPQCIDELPVGARHAKRITRSDE